MKNVNINRGLKVDRRSFLRGTGGTLALPWLEAMSPALALGDEAVPPRRFVSVTYALGLHGPNLFPAQPGRGYKPSLYLKQISDLLPELTVVSGVSHPGVGGGHKAEASILSAAPFQNENTFRNSISLDQFMARYLGGQTRYPSLVLNTTSQSSPSYTDNGAMIPAENSPSRLFASLFIDDTPEEQQRQIQRIGQGRSIMDVVSADARSLQTNLGAGDRDKLDKYFTSVRDFEKRLAASQDWVSKPKPKVNAKRPVDIANNNEVIAREKLMLDVMHLALQTDSSRFMTLHLNGSGQVVPIEGVNEGYHALSHHGQDKDKIAQLTRVETELVREWGGFVRKLKESAEGNGSLLDNTMVLLTSNLGNASSHDNKNMPVLFAGGGFKHGQHLTFNRSKNYPLPNLYLSALQRLGLEVDSFASSTGTLRGLEMT